MYQTWMDDSLVNFMSEQGLAVERFSFYTAPADKFSGKPELVALYIRTLFKLAVPFYKFRNDRVFCSGGHYAWMAMTRLFGPVLPPQYHLYLWNFYLHSLGKNPIVRAILRFLLSSKRITIIAQSPGDLEYFSVLSSNKPLFVPYCEDDYKVPVNFDLVPEGQYLFAGGYSNRDYQAVLKCARAIPEQQFVIVASRLNREFSDQSAPPNVLIYRDVDRDRFHGLLEKSTAVIVPLKEDVGSSGQMVCIAAMRLSKPVIFSDTPAISYFFQEGCGLPYEMGNADSLAEVVRQFRRLAPDVASEIGANSRKSFLLNFTKSQRNAQLLDVVQGNAPRANGVEGRL